MLGWQQIIEGQANAAGECEAAWAVPTNRPVTATRMACSGNSQITPPGAQSGQRYRGIWSNGYLVYSQLFSQATLMPPGFTVNNGAYTYLRVAAGAPNGLPDWNYAGQVQGDVVFGYPIWTMTKADIPQLDGFTDLELTAMIRIKGGAGRQAQAFINGGIHWTSASWCASDGAWNAWEKVTLPIGTAATWDFRVSNFSHYTPEAIQLAGIKINGKAASETYQINDVVYWGGYLWVCLAAGTTSEPTGPNNDWMQVPGIASSSGYPELRVFRNGTLIDASGNANADISDSMSIDFNPGDVIRANWRNCSPGARMRLAIDGTQA